MKKLLKIFGMTLVICLLLTAFAACGGDGNDTDTDAADTTTAAADTTEDTTEETTETESSYVAPDKGAIGDLDENELPLQ